MAYSGVDWPKIISPMSNSLASSDASILHGHTSSYTETRGDISISSNVKLSNEVTIHNLGKNTIQELTEVVEEFPQIWRDSGFAELSEQNWMCILLKTGWEEKLKDKAKIYPLGTRDREFVDKTFDELHELGKMSWTTNSTPFSYPFFVIWKNQPNEEGVRQVVIDIRGLNKITVPDVYLLLLQSDIIFAVRNCS